MMKRLIIHNHLPARDATHDVVSGAWEKAISDDSLSSVDLLKATSAEELRLRQEIQKAHQVGDRPKVSTLESVLKHVSGRGRSALNMAVQKETAKVNGLNVASPDAKSNGRILDRSRK